MAFYYLKDTRDKPKNENGFKYLAYFENYDKKPIQLSFDKGVSYYAFELLDKPLWNADDDVIDVVGAEKTVLSRFKKIHDEVGFTVWQNENYNVKS